jgi:large subunit ribosomal protein L4
MTLSPLEVKSQQGSVTATVELDPAMFAVQPNIPVIHQVVTAQRAAARSGTQSTKTRAEVSGGGAKPYRQKGTGRARQGSTRAPHYAGGGVALGPKPRSYRQRTPRKMVQLALRGALSDRAASGQVAVVEGWDWEVPSTKDALAALTTLGLTGRVLVVLSREDERAFKSFRNLSGVDLVLVPELNAYDVLCSDWVVFTRATLPGHSTWGEAPASTSTSGAKAEPEAKAGKATATAAAATEPSELVDEATGSTEEATASTTEVGPGTTAGEGEDREPEDQVAEDRVAGDEETGGQPVRSAGPAARRRVVAPPKPVQVEAGRDEAAARAPSSPTASEAGPDEARTDEAGTDEPSTEEQPDE